jgi:large subunit ribosomal protein L21e
MIRSKGYHNNSRKWLRRNPEEKGKIDIKLFLQKFKQGEKVIIYPYSWHQRNIPSRRFFGRMGIIVGQRGRAYEVEVADGNKIKHLQLYPWHLKRV